MGLEQGWGGAGYNVDRGFRRATHFLCLSHLNRPCLPCPQPFHSICPQDDFWPMMHWYIQHVDACLHQTLVNKFSIPNAKFLAKCYLSFLDNCKLLRIFWWMKCRIRINNWLIFRINPSRRMVELFIGGDFAACDSSLLSQPIIPNAIITHCSLPSYLLSHWSKVAHCTILLLEFSCLFVRPSVPIFYMHHTYKHQDEGS